MTTLAPIKGVIFDLDGTLVESNLNFHKIRQQLGCPVGTDLLHFVDDIQCNHEQTRAHQIILEHERLDAQDCKPIDGASSLLTLLNRIKLPHALVTRNSRHATQTKLLSSQISIPTVLTREDYPAKPAPDALLAIAAQWQIEPKNIIYVGDYLYDIQAANNAGMIACFINHGQRTTYQHQAQLIINNLNQLQGYLEQQAIESELK